MWRVKVGIEIHARILAQSKLLSGASSQFVRNAQYANSQVALFDLGTPGTLPSINEECVDQAIRTGIALNGEVKERSVFERKHYFYGDSPLGFQVTQQRWPIVVGGVLDYQFMNGRELRVKKVRITRIQLEQDTGRMVGNQFDVSGGSSLLDLNRAGTGVMEIVTEPDMDSAMEAGEFVRSIQNLLRTIGSCDGNMENGSLRVDVNVSVHNSDLGIDSHRVEVKNLNSIRSVVRAVEHEAERLEVLYGSIDGPPGFQVAETRSFDALAGVSEAMRKKEKGADYRFFPEPDLRPLVVSASRIKHIADTMPEYPEEIIARLKNPPIHLDEDQARVLFGEPGGVAYFESVLSCIGDGASMKHPGKAVASWMCNHLFGLLHARDQELESVPPESVASVICMVDSGYISQTTGKTLLAMVVDGESSDPREIVDKNQWAQLDDDASLFSTCEQVVKELEKTRKGRSALKAYFKGKDAVFGVFLGHAMKMTEGRANPQALRKVMQTVLERAKPKA
mmetsp:Transcript_17824/g.28862  ORF Transcript_17824/g.28862 Transcript_17824/m.28862 type:complete len:508 (+) Transcript_17824:218-1741(+)